MAAISEDREERKGAPMARAALDYFPAAWAAVAECSRVANDFHNPGEDIHWARDKSNDHADCIIRHLVDRGAVDSDGIRHSAKVAWRALALLQEELEAQGATPGRASKWMAEESVQEPEMYRVLKVGDTVSAIYDNGQRTERWVGKIEEIYFDDFSVPYKVTHPTFGYLWANSVARIDGEG